jgi:hypothetical protein
MRINLRLALTFISRLAVTFIFIAITAFCCFGFRASFEPQVFSDFVGFMGLSPSPALSPSWPFGAYRLRGIKRD